MEYHWDWLFFFRVADDGRKYYEWILSGTGWTVAISLGAILLAFVIGSMIGTMQTSQNKLLRRTGEIYVDIFRNIPLIVQLFLWFFIFPELLPDAVGFWVKQQLPFYVTAVTGLGLYTAARVAEQIKSGLQSLPAGRRTAALALGFTEWEAYRYVRLPMAYRIVLPSLTSEAMNVFKNSAVTYAVGMMELYFQYKQIIEKTSQVLEITIVVTIIYFLLAFCVNRAMTYLEKKSAIPGLISGNRGGQ